MSQDIELNVTPASLEQLRCGYCQGYLSSSPIYLLPDGTNLCSLCAPLHRDKIFCRQLSLEAVLSNAVFPCKFKKHGCVSRLLFDHITEHEARCMHDIFDSFGVPSGAVESAEKWVNLDGATQEPALFVEDELERHSTELPAAKVSKKRRRKRGRALQRFRIRTGKGEWVWMKKEVAFALGLKTRPVDPKISTTDAPVIESK